MTPNRPAARRGSVAGNRFQEDNWPEHEHNVVSHPGEELSTYRRVEPCSKYPPADLSGACSEWLDDKLSGIASPIEIHGGGEKWIYFGISGGQREDDQITTPIPNELAEALQDLADVPADAEEDGLDLPSAVAFQNAERLLKEMHFISPRRFGVYPVSDGYIAIDARGANDAIAVVMCQSDGSVLCLVTIGNEPRRSWYYTATGLPDGFIREALLALGEESAR